MRILIGFLFIFCAFYGIGQITAEQKAHNFGDLYPNMERYVDIKFTNHTDKRHFILNVDRPREVSYVYSQRAVMPDSSITLRLQVNNSERGRFNHEIDVYFSDSDNPTTIRLSGNIKEVSSNPLTECPDFNSNPPRDGRYSFEITVKVIDSLTREPIRRSKVYFVQNNTLVGEYYTNKDGIIHRSFPMGYYFITAQKESYRRNYKEGYLNFQRNYVEIELQRPPDEVEPPEPDETDEIVVHIDPPEPDETDEIVIVADPDPEPEPEIDTVVVVDDPPYIDDTPLAELPDSLFDKAHFRTNNITFILDVSSSMNSSGKIELLKHSMTELAGILRPDDRISIIKYASTVSVVLEDKTGDDKEEIIEKVNSLTTSSSTAGGDAIKTAYRINNSRYAPDRNNIVIMITDGAFNKGSKDYLETITQNHQEKGIIFSVVGIKTSPYITDHMQNVVSNGGGDFVEIRTLEDAEKELINEIKRTSFRGR